MQSKSFSNSLCRCIQRADYVSALQRLATFPEEALSCHPLTNLLENVTFKRIKPGDLDLYFDLFRSLLRAFPSAVDSNLLLHRACAFVTTCSMLASARNGCVQIILDELPEAVLTHTDHNWLALHYACFSNLPLEILKALIDVAPTTVCCETVGGATALNILWDRYAMDDSYSCILSPFDDNDFITDLWQKIVIIVEAAFLNDFRGRVAFHPLLAFAAIPHTTVDMMKMALVKYKSSVRWTDACTGNNILHMCATFNRSTARTIASHCSNKEIICAILESDPSVARQVNKLGRYPFMCAVLSGIDWDDGLSDIFQHSVLPDVITMQDRETKLFPFMAAKSIESTYHILREAPEMIACCSSSSQNYRIIQ